MSGLMTILAGLFIGLGEIVGEWIDDEPGRSLHRAGGDSG